MAERFLRPAGAHANTEDGTSYDTAWLSAASVNVSAGDTLYIAGTITERVNYDSGVMAGTANNVTIRGDWPGDPGILAPASVFSAISLRNRSGLVLKNISVAGTPSDIGVDIVGSATNCRVEGVSIVITNSKPGILARPDGVTGPSGVQVVGCFIDCTDSSTGMQITGSDCEIRFCYVTGKGDHAFNASPYFRGEATSGWTAQGGGVYSRVLSFAKVTYVFNRTDIVWLTDEGATTTPSAGAFGFTGGSLYVHLSDSADANAHTISYIEHLPDNVTFSDCVADGWGTDVAAEGHAFVLDDQGGGSTGVRFERCEAKSPEGHCFQSNIGRNFAVVGSVGYDAGAPGTVHPTGVARTGVNNANGRTDTVDKNQNTMVACRSHGFNLQHYASQGGDNCKNNITTDHTNCGITDPPDSSTIDFNCIFNNTETSGTPDNGTNAVTTDPVYLDATNNDYRLDAGSSCIGAGTEWWASGAVQPQGADGLRYPLRAGSSTESMGSELVTNGTFTTDTTGWLASVGCTIASVAGVLEITSGEGATVNDGAIQLSVSVSSSTEYRFMVDVLDSNSEGWRVVVTGDVSGTLYDNNGTGAATISTDITTGGSDTAVSIQLFASQTPAVNDVVDYDNVSLKEITMSAAGGGPEIGAYPVRPGEDGALRKVLSLPVSVLQCGVDIAKVKAA